MHKLKIQLGYLKELDLIIGNQQCTLLTRFYLNCYFKAPLLHYKTSLVYDFSIGSSKSLSDRMSSFTIKFKVSFD